MYLDLTLAGAHGFAGEGAANTARPAWSVVVPFFNEAALLPAMLASLAAQTRPCRVVLVDNASTDGSGALAAATCRALGISHLLVEHRVPGKVPALAAGLDEVTTPFVATCDADTLYPPCYLAEAELLLSDPGCVVAGAFYAAPDASPDELEGKGRRMTRAARLLPRQCHTGGAGQSFRTAELRAAGGFDPRQWNLVLEDHEIIHRVTRFGAMRYSARLWCSPSPRERNRDSIRWTLVERLLYSASAPWAGDWFFYDFLAGRLRGRKLTSDRIRERQFQGTGVTGEPAYSVC